MTARWLAGFWGVCLVVVPLTDIRAQGSEERIKALEHQVVSPCCYRQTVDEHQSGTAATVRDKIREGVQAGRTDRQILDELVAEYGEAVLAEPEFSGFNMLLILAIIGAIAGGGALVLFVLRRWQAAPAPAQQTQVDAAYTRRVVSELDETMS